MTFLLVTKAATADIVFIAAEQARGASGVTNIVVPKPTGTAANHVMMAGVTVSPSTATITAPTGWTLIRRTDNASGPALATYYKVAGGSEPASYTWTVSAGASGTVAGIQVYSGVDIFNPVNVHGGVITPNGTSHTAPSVTSTVTNGALITWHAFSSSATWTPPTGMFEIIDVMSQAATGNAGVSMAGCVVGVTVAGATGTRTAIASNNPDVGCTASIVMKAMAPPTATNLSAGETYTEDVPLNLTDIVVGDASATSLTVMLELSDVSAGSLSTGTSGAVTSTYNPATGTWSASGAIADLNTLLANLTFTPTANYNSAFTIATEVSNGIAQTSGSKAVTGIPVNDPPTATNLSAAETYTEDTVRNLTDIVVTDVDSTVTVTLTLSNPSAGSLSTGTAGAVTSTYNSSTGVWTASGAVADVNTLLAGVSFTPAANFNSSFTIATSVSDGVAPAITGSKAFTGIAVNDPPTATNLSAAETYTEDTSHDLVDIVVTDVDSTVTVTLTLSNPSAGSLSTGTSGAVTSAYNSGTGVWTAAGNVSDVNTLLAAVTFVPTTNFNGSFTIATSVSDGVAPALTGNKAMTGVAVNDPPTATNLSAAETYTEDTSRDLVDIVVTDVDSTVTVTLTLSNPSAGSLSTSTAGALTSTYNSSTGVWTAAGNVSGVNTLLAGVTFVPAADFNGSFTIATSVSDGVAPALTGSKAFTGIAVNDPPTATNLSAAETYTEDTSRDLVDIVVTDVDSTVTVTLTLSNPSAGSLSTGTAGAVTSTYNSGTGVWTAAGNVSEVNTLLAAVTFVPAADFNGSFTIATSVSDGVAPALTGSKAVTGIPVNDPPTATNLSAAETYTEDTIRNLTDIVVTDVDSPVTVTLTLSNPGAGSLSTATSGAVTSTYNSGTGVWTASGTVVDVNTLLAGVSFTPTANFNSSFTIATSVSDGVAPAITGSKAFTGIAVNDPPTATNLSAAETYTEDTSHDLVDIVVTDVDSAVTVTLTLSNPSAGSLSTGTSGAVTSAYNSGTGVWTAAGNVSDVNTLLAAVTFVPTTNFNGSFTIATSVSDGVAPALTGNKAMTGVAVNDPPTATNLSAAETYTEDTSHDLVDIVVTDVDSAVTVTLTLSNPSAGSLSTGTSGAVTSAYNSGAGVWTAAGNVSDVNTLLAAVTFVPAADFNGSFTIATSVSDGVAPALTGSKAVTGIPVNDPPTATNLSAAESYTEDTIRNLTDIVVTDVDSPVTVTLTLSNPSAGSLSTATSSAVTSTYNSGTGVWTASGTVVDVNTLLAGVSFTPAANFNSSFTIATSVSDGVAPAITGSKAFTGIAVNDPPTATNLSAAETYTEDTSHDLVDIVVTDVDSAVTVTLTLSNPSAGSLSTGTSGAVTSAYNSGTGVWTAAGNVSDVNTLLAAVTFVPAADFNGSFTIATSVSDGVAPALTGSKPVTGIPVNDPPTATNLSAAETYTEDTIRNLTDIMVTDVDSTVTVTLTLSNPSAGSLSTSTAGAITSTYNSGTGVWTAAGNVSEVNTLLAAVTFVPAPDFNGSFTIATSVSDGVAPALTGSKAVTGIAVNDTPTDLALSSASIPENSIIGTAIGNLTTTDPDAGDTHSYEFAEGAGGDDNASFTIVGTSLKSAASFDYETRNSYTIRVRTTDAGGLSFEKVFTVNVTDVGENEAPTDIELSSSSIQENKTAGELIGTFTAVDANETGTHTFSLVDGTGDADNASFTIIGNSLKSAATFDYETRNSYSIRVRATDSGNLSFEKSFTISVSDTNEAPVFSGNGDPISYSVTENSPIGTLVGTVSASDPDGGQTVAYDIVAGNTNGAFAINPANGEITVSNEIALDFETTPEFSLTVRATDNGSPGLSTDTTVTITVENVTGPMITQQPQSQDAEAGSDATLSVTASSEVPISYQWYRGASGNTANPVAEGTNSSISFTVDYLGASNYWVQITGDGATNSATATITGIDTTAPTFGAVSNILVSAPALACSASVSFDFSATDNFGTPSISYAPASGSAFPIGTNEVTASAVDTVGNTNTITFSVIVEDVTAPLITCPVEQSYTNVSDHTFQAAAPDFTSTVSAVDCTSTTLTQSPAPGTVLGLGSHTITFTARDAYANESTCAISWHLIPPAPTIVQAPCDQVVVSNATLTLNVEATSTQLLYQWRKDGVPIPDGTNQTLVIANVVLTDAGQYDVVISNDLGTATSSAARVDILVPGPLASAHYQGLFYGACGVVKHLESGDFRITVVRGRAIQFVHRLAGTSYAPIAATIDTNYVCTVVSGGLTFTIHSGKIDGVPTVYGTVAGPGWTSHMLGFARMNTVANPSPFAGKYAMILEPAGGDANPGGYGIATVHVAPNGVTTIRGRLGDGTLFGKTTLVTTNGEIPFYVCPGDYVGRGSAFGWLTLHGSGTNRVTGDLLWTKTGGGTRYKAGFTNVVSAIGSVVGYTAGLRAINITNATAFASGGNITTPISVPLHINDLNVITSDISRLRLLVTSPNGFIYGRMKNPATGTWMTVHAFRLQSQNEIRGFVLGKTKTGAFTILANP